MSTTDISGPIGSIAAGARRPTAGERSAMCQLLELFDNAMLNRDYDALKGAFHAGAIAEFKPAGIRITSLDTLTELYRRTLPRVSGSLLARQKQREWSNQNGVVREWSYPVILDSGEEIPTSQLEVIEFSADLGSIARYRCRMNQLYSKTFERALEKDFYLLTGIERVSG